MFKVLALEEWPEGLGKPLVLIRQSPAELERQFSIKFQPHPEDPEFIRAVLIEAHGRHFGLMDLKHALQPGTEVWVHHGVHDLEQAIRDVQSLLRLRNGDVLWTAMATSAVAHA